MKRNPMIGLEKHVTDSNSNGRNGTGPATGTIAPSRLKILTCVRLYPTLYLNKNPEILHKFALLDSCLLRIFITCIAFVSEHLLTSIPAFEATVLLAFRCL